VFVPGKSSQPSLMFVSRAGAYPSEAFFRCFTLVFAPGLTHKHRPERLARDKHFSLLQGSASSFLQKVINYDRKKFYNIEPRTIKLYGHNCCCITIS